MLRLLSRLAGEIVKFPLNLRSLPGTIAICRIEPRRLDTVDKLTVAEGHLVVFADGDDAYTVVDIHPIGMERTELATIRDKLPALIIKRPLGLRERIHRNRHRSAPFLEDGIVVLQLIFHDDGIMGIGGKSEILSYFSSGSHQLTMYLEGAVGSRKLRFSAQPGLRIVITAQEIARTFIFIRNNNLGILHRPVPLYL